MVRTRCYSGVFLHATARVHQVTPFFRPFAPARTLFLGSHFGDRDGVQGHDGCADEDENPGLRQP